MQRRFLITLLFLVAIVSAKSRQRLAPAQQLSSDSAISSLAAAPADSAKPTPAAPATDTALSKSSHDTSAQAIVPPPPSADTLAVAQDSTAHRPVLLIDSVAEAKDRAYRDSLRTAREEQQNSMEWHVVSDSGTSATVTPLSESVQETTHVAAPPPPRSRSPFPDVPEEQESRVLMWTGVSLAVVGLAAFLLFSNVDGVNDATAATPAPTNPGDANAPTQKTMTIKWAQ